MRDARAAQGRRAALVGIAVNLLLSATKFFAGLITHSVAVTADAVNNLSDTMNAAVALFAMRMAAKPFDREHPFGHGRMEYVGGLIVGMVILLMGIELLKSGVQSIISPAALTFSGLAFTLMGLSVLVKLFLYFFYSTVDKKIDSPTMRAAAKDSVSDVFSTGGILLSMLLTRFFGWQVDGYVGVVVALLVLKTGYSVCKETIDMLLGGKPDQELGDRLTQRLLSYEGILGVHDMVIHDYGPGRCVASVHAEVSAKSDIVEIHEVIDLAEREISKDFYLPICIHMDPIVTDDKETGAVKERMTAFIQSVDSRLRLHDFRRVPGDNQTNLIFDVLLPMDYGDEAALLKQISRYAQTINDRYACVVHFDRDRFQ